MGGFSNDEIEQFFNDASSSETTTATTTNTAPAKSIRQDPKFKKFNMMIKMHLPEPVIRNKMKQAGISEQDIESFLADKPAASSKPAVEKPAVKEVSFRENPKVKKYLPMLRMHLPPHVVSAKMSQAGLSKAEITAFLEDKPLKTESAAPAVSFRKNDKVKKFLPMLRYVTLCSLPCLFSIVCSNSISKKQDASTTTCRIGQDVSSWTE